MESHAIFFDVKPMMLTRKEFQNLGCTVQLASSITVMQHTLLSYCCSHVTFHLDTAGIGGEF